MSGEIFRLKNGADITHSSHILQKIFGTLKIVHMVIMFHSVATQHTGTNKLEVVEYPYRKKAYTEEPQKLQHMHI